MFGHFETNGSRDIDYVKPAVVGSGEEESAAIEVVPDRPRSVILAARRQDAKTMS
jgi:hypothetical protein